MMGQLLVNGSLKQIKERISAGMPVFGICAGLILLSKNASDRMVGKMDQPLLDMIDVTVERNLLGDSKSHLRLRLAWNLWEFLSSTASLFVHHQYHNLEMVLRPSQNLMRK